MSVQICLIRERLKSFCTPVHDAFMRCHMTGHVVGSDAFLTLGTLGSLIHFMRGHMDFEIPPPEVAFFAHRTCIFFSPKIIPNVHAGFYPYHMNG